MTHKSSPWQWLPTLYVAEALPYVAVNVLTVLMYTKMGIGAAEMAFFTGWLYLPWVVKPFWSPFVDIFSNKRKWILAMQFLMGIAFLAVSIVLALPFFFTATLIFFWIIAFLSATHDIAADGYYMLALSSHQQATFVGIRSTFYRIGSLLAGGGLVWIAGCIEEMGNNFNPVRNFIPLSWMWVFRILAIFFLVIGAYHIFFLPKTKRDEKRTEHNLRQITKNLANAFSTFFQKPHIWSALAFMLLYRLPEALCIKLVAPFLLATRQSGGLALSTKDVGIANGITGVIAILAGGILGGIVIGRDGLKKWLWPMAAALTLPCVLYCLLAIFQPPTDVFGIIIINSAIFVEQFGYGFGFTAFMMYLIYFSNGPWATAHYAFCTAFMALGMMLPGMCAGWIYETLENLSIFSTSTGSGYIKFFWFVLACSAATAIACINVKIDANFGKKQQNAA